MSENVQKYETSLSSRNKFLAKVYGWMAVALIFSGVTALFTAGNRFMMNLLLSNGGIGFIGLIVGELILVWWLSASIRKISAGAAVFAFLVYSVLNGVNLSMIFLVYNLGLIFRVFFLCSAMFILMAVYGAFTKSNLASYGKVFMMLLLGVIIASVLNILFKSSSLDWIISLVSVVLFAGLTAYDTQKILRAAEYAGEGEVYSKASIIGALELYLDFINMFLNLLRIFGRNRR